MQITRSARPVRETAGIKLWHCVGCGVVHMSVKDVVLNFSREEFSTFTEAVVVTNYDGWQTERGIIDLVDHDADSYADAVMH